jgi:uncharacterized coiled-coil protein SlyX
MDDRIVDLEVRYSFQEKQLKELSEALFEQGQLLERLTLRVERIERSLRELFESFGPTPPNEKPPHY